MNLQQVFPSSRFCKAVIVISILGGPLGYVEAYSANLPHGDSSFVTDAADGGMDEVKLGEIAAQNASNDRVKTFGKRMVSDHQRLNDELRTLAGQKGIALPTDITMKQKASNKILSLKSGASFDKSYISSMLKDHKDDIEAFEKEANYGGDKDVKAFASRALPILREHLKMAEDLARSLGVTE